ncbi:hypothetical protein P7K49_002542 [Saguinus oedipus]|uniref:Uncharacterized protein n=1 Tax=Saguinus oedipus TaxID=9490 RepID=A0ABQ9WHP0_SAGOE|nr:hypothetical protein P7K49_002542 [Saguinus oedipus]
MTKKSRKDGVTECTTTGNLSHRRPKPCNTSSTCHMVCGVGTSEQALSREMLNPSLPKSDPKLLRSKLPQATCPGHKKTEGMALGTAP